MLSMQTKESCLNSIPGRVCVCLCVSFFFFLNLLETSINKENGQQKKLELNVERYHFYYNERLNGQRDGTYNFSFFYKKKKKKKKIDTWRIPFVWWAYRRSQSRSICWQNFAVKAETSRHALSCLPWMDIVIRNNERERLISLGIN